MATKSDGKKAKSPPKKVFNTRIVRVDPSRITLLEVNARYMTHEQFAGLVRNIRKDGVLTSTPLCWLIHDDASQQPYEPKEDGFTPMLVLSGNHRVMASIDAGLGEIDVILIEDYVAPDHRAAIQLSHNEITGQDDLATLKVIYSSIQDIDYRIYSGLDDKRLELLQDAAPASISEANLSFQTISMTFMPDDLDEAKAVWAEAEKSLTGSKAAWVTRFAQYDEWMDQIERTSRITGIKNVATCFQLILATYKKHAVRELEPYWIELVDGSASSDNAKLPIDAVFASPLLKARTLARMRRAADRMVSKGEIPKDSRESVIDKLLELYLGEDAPKSKKKKSRKKKADDSAENAEGGDS